MQAGDPRADPAIVDLIELMGLWLGAGDLVAFRRSLERLDAELRSRYPSDVAYADRFRALNERSGSDLEAVRRAYRQAIVG